MMRANKKLLILTMLVGLGYGCSDAQTATPELKASTGSKTLIIYLSRTGNTKAVAEMIQRNTGGNLVSLELETPYPEHYQTTVDQVAKENASGFLPALKTKVDSMGTYDRIFIGFPTWGMQLPPPIKSFLSNYNLRGKTVIPFNTNAGYGIGTSFDQVKSLCQDSKVLAGVSFTGGEERDGIYFVMDGKKEEATESEIKNWLVSLGVK
jgi:flavodoxin